MTNPELVLNAQADAQASKGAYVSYMTPLAIGYQENQTPLTTAQFLECLRLGNAYFNALENFVVDSGLLEAHLNGRWVTNLAESCHACLETYVLHYNFLRSHANPDRDSLMKPDKHAMAGMQRMVKEYLDKETSDTLFDTFITAGLPTQGFTVPAHEDVKKIPAWQLITCMTLGVVLVLFSAGVSIFVPYPSPYQTYIFRGIFSLGLSAAIAGVPGFIDLKIKINGWGSYGKIVAGGAVAIFVLAWMFNPPEIPGNSPPSPSSVSQPSVPPTSEK